MPFVFLDPKLKAAFLTLKKTPSVDDSIRQIEAQNIVVTIGYSSMYGGSVTFVDPAKLNDTKIFIDAAADTTRAKAKFGTKSPITDEISLAHELGHVAFECMKITGRFKKDDGKPHHLSSEQYDEFRSESYARYNQNKLMPQDEKVRLVDFPDPTNAVRGTLSEIVDSAKKLF